MFLKGDGLGSTIIHFSKKTPRPDVVAGRDSWSVLSSTITRYMILRFKIHRSNAFASIEPALFSVSRNVCNSLVSHWQMLFQITHKSIYVFLDVIIKISNGLFRVLLRDESRRDKNTGVLSFIEKCTYAVLPFQNEVGCIDRICCAMCISQIELFACLSDVEWLFLRIWLYNDLFGKHFVGSIGIGSSDNTFCAKLAICWFWSLLVILIQTNSHWFVTSKH